MNQGPMFCSVLVNGRRSDAANDPEYVKTLLGQRKEEAVAKLLMIMSTAREFHESTRLTYLKILPVFFSYTVVLNRTLAFSILKLISLLMNHQSFAKDKSLFHDWRSRIQMIDPSSSDEKRPMYYFERNLKNRHHFFAIRGTNDWINPICYTEIDYFISFHRYLKFHKLHKYLFFFGNLSYHEIMNIDSENIRQYEKKVNIFPMTEGARNAILRKLTDLKLREPRLIMISCVMKDVNGVLNLSYIEKLIEEIRNIIRTPIRGNTDLFLETSDGLPSLLSCTFRLLTKALIQNIRITTDARRKEEVNAVSAALCSLLKKAWAGYFFDRDEKNEFNTLRKQIETILRTRELDLVKINRQRELLKLMAAWKE